MAVDVLLALARANLAAGLAVLAVLLLRRPLRHIAGVRAGYLLWLIVPLAIAGALAPPRTLIVTLPAAASAAAHGHPTSAPADYSPLLLGAWLAGVALSLALLAERQRRFTATLGHLTRAPGDVLRAQGAGGPAVLGAFRPRIVLPHDFEDRFSGQERQAVLAHERQHLAAHHPQTNGLIALAQCLCWFNPAVWFAARVLRLDQELACDAATLTRSPSLSPRLYGEALLRTQLNAPPLPLGCHWPSSGPGPLKERLLMLKKPAPNRRARLIGATLIAATAAIAAATAWAAQPAQVRVVAQTPPVPSAPPSVTSNSVAGHRGVITPPVEPPSRPELINDPDWVDRPTAADLARLYPEPALGSKQKGQATINCAVLETGKLSGCSVVSESPEGHGFGQSALAMSGSFTMKPPSQGGSAMVNIPIKFDMK